MINVYEEKQLDFDGLYKSSWGGAIVILDIVKEKGLENVLMSLLEKLSAFEPGCKFERTNLNDFIAFDLHKYDEFKCLRDYEEVE